MTINLDSYQTSMGSVYPTKPIISKIQEAIIRDGIDNVNLNVTDHGRLHPVFITGFFDSETEIPLFTHPILVLNYKERDYLCTDLRLFVKKGTNPSEIASGIRNLTEYNFAKSRAILNLLWADDGVGDVKNTLQFASTVFSSWLSQTISKAFALDFQDQTLVSIVASLYYQGLFSNEKEWTEETKLKLTSHTINATKAPSEMVLKVVDHIQPMANLAEFCQAVLKVVDNVRLSKLNSALVLNMVSNSWYGTSAKEIIAVSLEHPPTWCAMVYTALSQRTYKNSSIFQAAERVGKRGLADQYMKAYTSLVRESLLVREDLLNETITPVFSE